MQITASLDHAGNAVLYNENEQPIGAISAEELSPMAVKLLDSNPIEVLEMAVRARRLYAQELENLLNLVKK